MAVGDVAQSAPFSSSQLSDPDMIDSLRRSIMEGLTIQTCAFRRCLDHTRKFRHAQLALRLVSGARHATTDTSTTAAELTEAYMAD